jgi:hypothetical protein
MAKRVVKSTTESALQGFAEDLGNMLGSARQKAEGWLGERQKIVKSLTDLRDTANKLLTDLGHRAEAAMRRGRKPGRSAGVAKLGRPVKQKRTMSAEARKRISDAQKKRWALQKAGEKKK